MPEISKKKVTAGRRPKSVATKRSKLKAQPAVRRPETREIYTVSLPDRYRAYPSRGLTPESLASYLQTADSGSVSRQSELFEEMMEKDCHLRGIMQTRVLAVTGHDWEIRPFSEDPDDIKTAGLVDEVLSQIPGFTRCMKDILSAIGHGYSLTEIIWEVNGRAVPKKLRFVPHKKISFYKDFPNPRLLTVQDSLYGIALPQNKFIYHAHQTTTGFAHRGGLLRPIAWLYLFKNYTLKDWVRFAEIYGMPLRLAKYSPGVSKADRDAILEALEQLATDAAGMIPDTATIEFIKTEVRASADVYKSLMSSCEAAMSKCVLGQTLTTEVGDKGSFAAARVHGDVRQDIVEDDAEQLSETIRDQLIKPVVIFNRGVEYASRLPWFKIMYEPPEDLQALAQRDKTLVDAGVPIPVRYFVEKYNLPEAEGDEPVVQRQTNPVTPFMPGAVTETQVEASCPGCGARDAHSPSHQAARRTPPATPQDIIRIEDTFVEASKPWLRKWRSVIEKFLGKVKSLAEARQEIQSLLNNAPGGFQEFVYDSSIYALLYGFWEEQQKLISAMAAPQRINPFGLPAAEAIAWFRQKQVVTPDEFDRLAEITRARAFTIKGVQDKYVLDSVKTEIGRALEEGTTFWEFKDSLDDIFDRAGLLPKSPWHLQTVFRTNTQTAYQAGHFRQMEAVKDIRPFWQYHAVGDDRTRPAHLAVDGIIKPADDPLWNRWYPPNGFNCRCTVTSISRDEMKEEKLKVTGDIPFLPGQENPDKGFTANPWEAFVGGAK